MYTRIDISQAHDGALWFHRFGGPRVRPAERHRELEWNFVVRGSATCLVNREKYTLLRGSQLWLFPAHEHLLLRDSEDCEMWVAVFRPRLLKRVCRSGDLLVLKKRTPPPDFCRRATVAAMQKLHGLLQDVYATRDDVPLFNTGLAYVLQSAWLAPRTPDAIAPVCKVHPSVEALAQLLSRNLNAGTAELCARAGLSASRMRRLFKAQAGLPIHAYRNRMMIERFMNIYGDGSSKKMLGAAYEAGFGSYAQFYRVFKECMGATPAEHYAGIQKS